jgi:uncharacterized protein
MSASAVYEGWVRHRRVTPVEHAFRYRVFMMYLDLDELPGLFDGVPLWSARRPAPARFRRSDFFGDSEVPLRDAVLDEVERQGGRRPEGPVRLLANLRYFGHGFNPVSFYFCFAPDGGRLDAVLAEVTNTPWGERHAYLLQRGEHEQGKVLREQTDKAFHVSPFIGMNHSYEWRVTEPGAGIQVHIENHSDGERAFDATLSLERREATPRMLNRVLARYPLMSLQVVARIYLNAVRLKLKGAPYHPHPAR